jgi:hypothetical protein
LPVEFKRSAHRDGFVWSDAVVDGEIVLDAAGEDDAVGDVVAVEIFVFDRAEEPFDLPVRPRRLLPCAHVRKGPYAINLGRARSRVTV